MTLKKPVRPEGRASRLKVQQTLKMARSAHSPYSIGRGPRLPYYTFSHSPQT
jgi:hypothetical protein